MNPNRWFISALSSAPSAGETGRSIAVMSRADWHRACPVKDVLWSRACLRCRARESEVPRLGSSGRSPAAVPSFGRELGEPVSPLL